MANYPSYNYVLSRWLHQVAYLTFIDDPVTATATAGFAKYRKKSNETQNSHRYTLKNIIECSSQALPSYMVVNGLVNYMLLPL